MDSNHLIKLEKIALFKKKNKDLHGKGSRIR